MYPMSKSAAICLKTFASLAMLFCLTAVQAQNGDLARVDYGEGYDLTRSHLIFTNGISNYTNPNDPNSGFLPAFNKNLTGMDFVRDGSAMLLTLERNLDNQPFATRNIDRFGIAESTFSPFVPIFSDIRLQRITPEGDGIYRGLALRPDGTKLFTLDTSLNALVQYNLPTRYTPNLLMTRERNFLLIPQIPCQRNFTFSESGTKLYVLDCDGNVHQYRLSSGFSLDGTITYEGFAFLTAGAQGLRFNREGSKLFSTDSTNRSLLQFSLTDAFDVTGTMALEFSFIVPTEFSAIRELEFNRNGTEVSISFIFEGVVQRLKLPQMEAFEETDANTGAVSGQMTLRALNNLFRNPGGTLVQNGDYLIPNLPAGLTPTLTVGPIGLDAVLTLSGNAQNHEPTVSVESLQMTLLPSAFLLPVAVDNTFNAPTEVPIRFRRNASVAYGNGFSLDPAPELVSSTATRGGKIQFSQDGTRLYEFDFISVAQYNLATPFDTTTAALTATLAVDGQVQSPQTVSLSPDGRRMFIAGGAPGAPFGIPDLELIIAQYRLDTPFEISSAIFEGIARGLFGDFASDDQFTDLQFSFDGRTIFGSRRKQSISSIELDQAFDVLTARAETRDLGPSFNEGFESFHFSDNGRNLFFLYPRDFPSGERGFMVRQYVLATPFDAGSASFLRFVEVPPINGLQANGGWGLDFNPAGTKLFVSLKRFSGATSANIETYALAIPDRFTETAANNGAVEGAQRIEISGQGSFANAGGTLVRNLHFSMANLPTGLTPVVNVNAAGNIATLSFTGTANDHQAINSVASLRLSFFDQAFTGGDAGSVLNAENADTGLPISFNDNLFTIGGTVTGLAGGVLTLQNNGGDNRSISSNGGFTFATALRDFSSYIVSVQSDPAMPSQTCTVSNGSGTVSGANVTNIAVSCIIDTFTVAGNVSGLQGGQVVLGNNGSSLIVPGNGGFVFPAQIDGTSYAVSVLTPPGNPSQTCSVSNGSGTLAGANVTTVQVVCVTDQFSIGGTVSGLAGSGLVLQNNAGDDLPIAADGSFSFATALDDLSGYAVSVQTQPDTPSQSCSVSNGGGTLAGADITTVQVVCVTDQFSIGGTVSGLAGNGLVLQNNAGDDLPIAADGSFSFATALDDLSGYAVSVLTQPDAPSQSCSVSNGGGTLAGADITTVQVVCVTDQFSIGGTVSGLAGSGLVLQNNAGDDLPIAADGSFGFATALDDGSAYEITVLAQPSGPIQTCSVANGSGSLEGGDVDDVTVACINEPPAATLSVAILDFGLVDFGTTVIRTVSLSNTGTGELTITAISEPGGPFAIAGGSCLPVAITLLPAEDCTIDVSFAPDVIGGTVAANFEILSNAISSPDIVNLRGAVPVIPVPALSQMGILLQALLMAMLGWVGMIKRRAQLFRQAA
jgi:hypothetical protein